MEHDAFEKEMFDTVSRHGKAADKKIPIEATRVVDKNDGRVVIRGLKRTLLALLTAVTFAASGLGFIVTAKVPGYLAVLLFFVSILALVASFVLLYSQGIISVESKGESK